MNYNFYKKEIETTKSVYFLTNIESGDYSTLENFNFTIQNKNNLQEIIDGIDNSRNKEYGEDYKWQNEDVLLISNKHGVFFIDLLAQRAGKKSEKQDLDLEHDEFIIFLQDFKKFIEENQ